MKTWDFVKGCYNAPTAPAPLRVVAQRESGEARGNESTFNSEQVALLACHLHFD
jgi:hypothetical protein